MIEWRWGLDAADAARQAREQPRLGTRLQQPRHELADVRRAPVHQHRLLGGRGSRRPGVRRVAGAQTASARDAAGSPRGEGAVDGPSAGHLPCWRSPWRCRCPLHRPRVRARHGSRAETTAERVPRPAYVPPIKHVFVINIENKGYTETFGAGTQSPYLAGKLRRKGVLLDHFYATAHNSLPNYLAQISGQAPNTSTQLDCQIYSPFIVTGPPVPPGDQAVGDGCVFPQTVAHPSAPAQPRQRSAGRATCRQMRRPCQPSAPWASRTPRSRRRRATTTPCGTTRSCTSAASPHITRTANVTCGLSRPAARPAEEGGRRRTLPTSPPTCAATATTTSAPTARRADWCRSTSS